MSPTQIISKKSRLIVFCIDHRDLVPTWFFIGWHVYIDYRKLNASSRKDHFSLSFIDQILERLAGQQYFWFLDWYLEYNHVAIYPGDQKKTTFTCPYGIFAFQRMPFELCNAPTTFQRYMISIFSDMVGDFLEIFMDDFLVFKESLKVASTIWREC